MKEVLTQRARIYLLGILLFAAIQCIPLSSLPRDASRPASARTVLFIGNSMTSVFDVPGIVEQMTDEPGCNGGPIRAVRHLPGGVWLAKHWEHGEVLKLVEREKPSIVVIQEQSDTSLRFPESRSEYSRRFVNLVREHKALPILYNIDIGWWTKEQRQIVDKLGGELEYELSVSSIHAIRIFDSIRERLPQVALFGTDNHHLSHVGATAVALAMVQLLCDAKFEFPNLPAREPDIVWDLWFHQRRLFTPSELPVLATSVIQGVSSGMR